MTTSLKQQFLKMIQTNQGLINSLCRVYSEESDFKDVRQEVLLQLWRAFPDFRAESKVSTWIYRVALNTLLAKKRKESRQIKWEPLGAVHGHLSQPPAFSDDHLQQLHYVISQLTDINKAIVVLYLEGYSHIEIADLLNLSPSNVSTRFGRIKQQLKQMIKKMTYGTQ